MTSWVNLTVDAKDRVNIRACIPSSYKKISYKKKQTLYKTYFSITNLNEYSVLDLFFLYMFEGVHNGSIKIDAIFNHIFFFKLLKNIYI